MIRPATVGQTQGRAPLRIRRNAGRGTRGEGHVGEVCAHRSPRTGILGHTATNPIVWFYQFGNLRTEALEPVRRNWLLAVRGRTGLRDEIITTPMAANWQSISMVRATGSRTSTLPRGGNNRIVSVRLAASEPITPDMRPQYDDVDISARRQIAGAANLISPPSFRKTDNDTATPIEIAIPRHGLSGMCILSTIS